MRNITQKTIFCLGFFLISGFNTTLFSQACRVTDSLALCALYDATNGANWNGDKWNKDFPVTSWSGVFFNTAGCVNSINLQGRGLEGTLPAAIADVESLELLALSNNKLSGSIPDQLGDLSALKVLDIGDNDFSGPIPSALKNLKNLEELFIYSNVELTGGVPVELSQLTKLEALHIWGNTSLGGQIPLALTVLTNLDTLDLNNNGLIGTIPEELSNLSKLIFLNLSNNKLTDTIPESLASLNQLKTLFLNGNQLSGCYAEALKGLCDRVNVNFSSNDALPARGIFSLYCNDLIPTCEEQMSCRYQDSITLRAFYDALHENGRWTREWDWENGTLDDFDGVHLENGCVSTIIIHDNNLSGTLPPEIGNFSNLKELSLDENDLKGGLPKELGNLTNLTWLSFSINSNVGGTIPKEIGNLVNLKGLYLSTLGLKGSIPAELSTLTQLIEFSLADNQLKDTIPAWIANFNQLERLLLFNNNLHGAVPSFLGELNNLTHLYLQFNKLNGCFPDSFSKFCNWENQGELIDNPGYYFGENPSLSWQGDFSNFCLPNQNQIETTCDDLDDATNEDKITADCICRGSIEEICQAVGGTINGGPFTFCKDNEATTIFPDAITLTERIGTNSQWVLTDELNTIVQLPASYTTTDYNELSGGNYLVWHLAYEDGVTGLAAGNTINGLAGCFSFSNSVLVTLLDPIGGVLTGGPFTFCLDGVPDNIPNGSISLSNNESTNNQWILTDLAGQVLELPATPFSINFDNASLSETVLVWNIAYENGLTGLAIGTNINQLSGCFSLSNSISISINQPQCNATDTINENCECVAEEVIETCRSRDSMILVTVYNATNGANWTNKWDLSQPIDTWFGVFLNDEGCVSCLDLDGNPNCESSEPTGNNLVGNLPDSIGYLANLERLYIQREDSLTGNLPVEIGQLTNLNTLFISNTKLSGQIPLVIKNLTTLKNLTLSKNEFTGVIPPNLDNLQDLRTLRFHINQLEGPLPEELANLPKLNKIYLHDNLISGCFPDSYQKFFSLSFQESSGGDGYNFTGNKKLPWEGDFENYRTQVVNENNTNQTGATCDDENVLTFGDFITVDCDCIGSLCQPTNATIQKQICQGDNFLFNNQRLTIAGTYTNTLQTAMGCDSIVTLKLMVNEQIQTDLEATICQGATYEFDNQLLSEANIYTTTLPSATGCDSIVTLKLMVNEQIQTDLEATICQGATYEFDNQILREANTYTTTLQSATGCDSIIILELMVNEQIQTDLEATICQGATYEFDNQILREANTYTTTLQSATGCDSTVTLKLMVNEQIQTNLEQTICFGKTYNFNGQTLNQSGTYDTLFTSATGCDSIIILDLTAKEKIQTNLEKTICSDETYNFNGQIINQSGTYDTILTSVTGCDSIVILKLVVNDQIQTNIEATICEGTTYEFDNQILSEANIYTTTLKSATGCDSTVILKLNVLTPIKEELDIISICEGESYTFGKQILTTENLYYDTISATNGCDSIIQELMLEVIPGVFVEAKTDTFIFNRPPNEIELAILKNDNYTPSTDVSITILSQPQSGNIDPENIALDKIEWPLPDELPATDFFTYQICLEQEGCEITCSTASVYLFFNQTCINAAIKEIPKAFAPNSIHSENKAFDPFLTFIEAGCQIQKKHVNLTILNRWGEVVFRSKGDVPWNGKDRRRSGGRLLPPNIYYYVFQYGKGKKDIVKGAINLVKLE